MIRMRRAGCRSQRPPFSLTDYRLPDSGPSSSVRAGLQDAAGNAVPLADVHIRGKIIDFVAQVCSVWVTALAQTSIVSGGYRAVNPAHVRIRLPELLLRAGGVLGAGRAAVSSTWPLPAGPLPCTGGPSRKPGQAGPGATRAGGVSACQQGGHRRPLRGNPCVQVWWSRGTRPRARLRALIPAGGGSACTCPEVGTRRM